MRCCVAWAGGGWRGVLVGWCMVLWRPGYLFGDQNAADERQIGLHLSSSPFLHSIAIPTRIPQTTSINILKK